MSGLPVQAEDRVNGVDVREQGNSLRVATNTPHLVSLGTGRLSTAVTLHPIKQGRVTIGSDPTCDIYVLGTGVSNVHCRVENSHGVVTLYPVSGTTLLDGLPVDKATRLSQGSMLTIGRSNYLRFNHPEEAKLMKSVLPGAHLSMAPIQFTPNEDCLQMGYQKNQQDHCYQNVPQNTYREANTLSQVDRELDVTLKELSKRKPPAVPKKPYKEIDTTDSETESHKAPKTSSIMAKVSKFEYYAKSQQKTSKSQFYTHENEISPKVFSANSLTVNTPAKDVLVGKKLPSNLTKKDNKVIYLNENNAVDSKSCSYANVAIKNRNKIDEIVRNFDDSSVKKLPKKINNDQQEHVYGRINVDYQKEDLKVQNSMEKNTNFVDNRKNFSVKPSLPSPSFDREPQYSPVYANTGHMERSFEAETKRFQAYQDRVKEEEQKDAENARLEEILNMCAEYERQISTGTPITPTEKRSHNKIITNGSLPRSVALNNPNFVQTSEGYYKFDTNHSHSNGMSQSLPAQRHLSSYENIEFGQPNSHIDQLTPQVVIKNAANHENAGRMDEIGIPITDNCRNELSSPILIRKLQNSEVNKSLSPIGSPYENVLNRGNLKPKSPNTQSPRTRIKTTFAHKNLTSPQYFVFPTPPPVDNANKPNFVIPNKNESKQTEVEVKIEPVKEEIKPKVEGIEKQLSLEEDIPMIDDSDLTDDIEFRYSKVVEDCSENLTKNQSFDDVKKELMADIPELDEFEKDLKQNREKIINKLAKDVKSMDVEADSIGSGSMNENNGLKEMKDKYEALKEERKKLMTEIHELKCKMSEIRSQEDDILRELEMEKALIKGEYDSEIAILNIEQKKKAELVEQSKKIEEEIKTLKQKQESRQSEMKDRVEIATTKVERLEKDLDDDQTTVEELQNAQDILDNETKIYEDLEFQHLEEESELLSNREDIQNEIMQLTKKIESQKNRILTLKSEANNNLTSALDETKVLQAEYVKLLNEVEKLTNKIQAIEKELKPIVTKLNDIERTQSPDSAFFTDQTRAKSGEFGYSPPSSDDDLDIGKLSENHNRHLAEKFNSIDQMSQSMLVDIERREVNEIVDDTFSESPSKLQKEKKGFWERNFDSLKRKKKPKSPEKIDIMSQSLNENFFYNDAIETEQNLDRFNSLRNSKKKKDANGPLKSNSSSKIPTFAALGKIIKKDSFGKSSDTKNRYVKNGKANTDSKYNKSKSVSPEKMPEIAEDGRKDRKRDGDLDCQFLKMLHRKSCGDEPSKEFGRMSDKVPSQDDIDRISKVTLDAPILSSDTDMDSLGQRAVDSLKEIERKRMELLEEQGCQVIENEREKISELKRRVQSETKKLWDERNRRDKGKSLDDSNMTANDRSYVDSDSLSKNDRNRLTDVSLQEDSSYMEDPFNMTGSTVFDESSALMSSSIEELQVRNSRTESTEDEKRSDDSRPLSHASDFSRDQIISGAPRRSRRVIAPWGESRPLTRYLPVDRDDFDLRRHVESAGHQIDLCPHVSVSSSSCRGYLHKLGAKFHTWSKRWFVFDRDTKTFVYYWDKSERKPRGGAYFQVIEEVYLDHGNTSKSPNPQTTFIVKTRQRKYYLMAPSGESARIWIDVIFTGAQGYTEYLE